METSLHRQLKSLYGGPDAQLEVRVDDYRIDAVADGRLVEIQHASLGAFRDKIRSLVERHEVLIVKPIIARKLLVRLAERGGEPVGRRMSPRREDLLEIFDELVHFTNVFPHPRLTLELVLVQIEEHRYPGHGRRRRWSVDDYEVEDQVLVEVQQSQTLRTAADLLSLLPARLPRPFHTGDLVRLTGVARRRAQQIAYCLDRMGAARQVGKQGNTRLYEVSAAARTAFATRPKRRVG
jgi:hypothetical protein